MSGTTKPPAEAGFIETDTWDDYLYARYSGTGLDAPPITL